MERYVLSGAEAPELIVEVDRFWSRAEDQSRAEHGAEEVRVDVSHLAGKRREDLFEFRTPRRRRSCSMLPPSWQLGSSRDRDVSSFHASIIASARTRCIVRNIGGEAGNEGVRI